MQRKIIRIDEDKCNGCGQCAIACAEGALKIIDGKARLVSEVYCDGLGACIGECPQGALTIEVRDADEFDEQAMNKHMGAATAPAMPQAAGHAGHQHHAGCPGSRAMALMGDGGASHAGPADAASKPSRLGNWPVQLMLAPVQAPFYDAADLLISADCVPYALANFHEQLLAGKVVLVGCPKLDNAAFYAEKLTAILKSNNVRSITVAHMEVPCCNGIVLAVRTAIEQSGKSGIVLRDVTVGIRGAILSDQQT